MDRTQKIINIKSSEILKRYIRRIFSFGNSQKIEGIAVMKRTIVIGSPGAGKSTFARKHRESGFVGGKIDEGRMLDLQGSAGIS